VPAVLSVRTEKHDGLVCQFYDGGVVKVATALGRDLHRFGRLLHRARAAWVLLVQQLRCALLDARIRRAWRLQTANLLTFLWILQAAISIETRSEHFGHGARHDVDERLRAFREAPAVYDRTNTAISKPYYNLQVGARHFDGTMHCSVPYTKHCTDHITPVQCEHIGHTVLAPPLAVIGEPPSMAAP
jgi:hypothetical protein